jgi:hypothetical protein
MARKNNAPTPSDLSRLADVLRQERPHLSALKRDEIKRDVLGRGRRPQRGFALPSLRRRLMAMTLAVGLFGISTSNAAASLLNWASGGSFGSKSLGYGQDNQGVQFFFGSFGFGGDSSDNAGHHTYCPDDKESDHSDSDKSSDRSDKSDDGDKSSHDNSDKDTKSDDKDGSSSDKSDEGGYKIANASSGGDHGDHSDGSDKSSDRDECPTTDKSDHSDKSSDEHSGGGHSDGDKSSDDKSDEKSDDGDKSSDDNSDKDGKSDDGDKSSDDKSDEKSDDGDKSSDDYSD